jgi:hypothetical protein
MSWGCFAYVFTVASDKTAHAVGMLPCATDNTLLPSQLPIGSRPRLWRPCAVNTSIGRSVATISSALCLVLAFGASSNAIDYHFEQT